MCLCVDRRDGKKGGGGINITPRKDLPYESESEESSNNFIFSSSCRILLPLKSYKSEKTVMFTVQCKGSEMLKKNKNVAYFVGNIMH